MLVLVEVIGSHNAPSLAFGNGSLERRQIDFMQGAVAHNDVHLMTVFLIVVQRIVLHTGRRTRALQSLDIWHHHTACQIRVFAHIFEVAAVERGSVDVHSRPQHHVFAAIDGFLSECHAIVA